MPCAQAPLGLCPALSVLLARPRGAVFIQDLKVGRCWPWTGNLAVCFPGAQKLPVGEKWKSLGVLSCIPAAGSTGGSSERGAGAGLHPRGRLPRSAPGLPWARVCRTGSVRPLLPSSRASRERGRLWAGPPGRGCCGAGVLLGAAEGSSALTPCPGPSRGLEACSLMSEFPGRASLSSGDMVLSPCPAEALSSGLSA